MKLVIQSIMDAACETKYSGAYGGAVISEKPRKPVVVNEELLPDNFIKVERKVDKKAINEAYKNGEEIPGVMLDNGGLILTVRSK